ncbi:MAG: hypothetical protein KDB53_07310, partial [Planctomycetes bacterium]|nr:hypothetical protein [Planctomycetota bacterium]
MQRLIVAPDAAGPATPATTVAVGVFGGVGWKGAGSNAVTLRGQGVGSACRVVMSRSHSSTLSSMGARVGASIGAEQVGNEGRRIF